MASSTVSPFPLETIRFASMFFTIASCALIGCSPAQQQTPPVTTESVKAPDDETASSVTPAESREVGPPEIKSQAVDDEAIDNEEVDDTDFEDSPHLDNEQTITIDAKWKRLGKNQIWINHEDKQVMVRGRICLQEGPLEMFACPGSTKAHESVIATEAKASEIHASFEALGFPPGKPVQWDPKYTPAEGPLVKILVSWQEGNKLVQVNAREMVKVSGTDKPLEEDWVFGGSQIYHDNVSGEKIYYADSGEMVCLSNFSTAMLDVQIESSDAADGLLFEANQDKIPPPNTKVYMTFVPREPATKPTAPSSNEAKTKNSQSPDQ